MATGYQRPELPLLRAYLKKRAWEEDLRRIAPLHPILRIAHRR